MNGLQKVPTWALQIGLAFLAAILLWVSVSASERLSIPTGMSMYEDVVVLLPVEDPFDLTDASRVTPEIEPVPAYTYSDPTRSPGGVFEKTFNWTEADGDIALYLSFTRRISRIELNGTQVTLTPMLQRQSLFDGYVPDAYMLDPALLVEGSNTVRIYDRGRSKKVLSAFMITSLNDAFGAAFWGQFFQVDLVIAGVGVMLFVIVFTILMPWSKEDRPAIYAFIGLLAVWCIRSLSSLGLNSGIPDQFHVVASYWISYALICAFGVYVAIWSGRSRKWLWGYFGVLAVSVLITGLATRSGNQATFETAFPIDSLMTFGIGGIVIYQLISAYERDDWPRALQIVLLLIAVGSIIIDALDDRFDISLNLSGEGLPLIFYAAPRYGILVALGLLTAMIYQQIRARRMANDLNGILDTELRRKEAELRTSFEAQRKMEQAQVRVAERERIMMDVHDGIGARLLDLERLSRVQNPDTVQINREIHSTMAEVRLIADSLNNHGANLQIIMASLKQRLDPQFKDSGIKADWDISDMAAQTVPTPEEALHISRIILEASSNILRHSEATQVDIEVDRPKDDPSLLSIVIRDNGVGLAPDKVENRGLGFMRRRAEKLGGTLSVQSSSTGTSLSLLCPV